MDVNTYIDNLNIKQSWKTILKKCITQNEFDKINKNIFSKKYYPNENNIFEVFKYFELNETKVIILGQDCYINSIIKNNIEYPQANGLAFSVNKYHKVPSSLRNIYKELYESVEGFNIPNHGDLSRWVKEEKILLLNCSLTVEPNNSNSHMKYWKNISNKIIKEISQTTNNIVFVLWGNFAKSKKEFIDIDNHYIIESVHPSPLSANIKYKGTNKSFFGNNQFNKINDYLTNNNIDPIKWNIN